MAQQNFADQLGLAFDEVFTLGMAPGSTTTTRLEQPWDKMCEKVPSQPGTTSPLYLIRIVEGGISYALGKATKTLPEQSQGYSIFVWAQIRTPGKRPSIRILQNDGLKELPRNYNIYFINIDFEMHGSTQRLFSTTDTYMHFYNCTFNGVERLGSTIQSNAKLYFENCLFIHNKNFLLADYFPRLDYHNWVPPVFINCRGALEPNRFTIINCDTTPILPGATIPDDPVRGHQYGPLGASFLQQSYHQVKAGNQFYSYHPIKLMFSGMSGGDNKQFKPGSPVRVAQAALRLSTIIPTATHIVNNLPVVQFTSTATNTATARLLNDTSRFVETDLGGVGYGEKDNTGILTKVMEDLYSAPDFGGVQIGEKPNMLAFDSKKEIPNYTEVMNLVKRNSTRYAIKVNKKTYTYDDSGWKEIALEDIPTKGIQTGTYFTAAQLKQILPQDLYNYSIQLIKSGTGGAVELKYNSDLPPTITNENITVMGDKLLIEANVQDPEGSEVSWKIINTLNDTVLATGTGNQVRHLVETAALLPTLTTTNPNFLDITGDWSSPLSTDPAYPTLQNGWKGDKTLITFDANKPVAPSVFMFTQLYENGKPLLTQYKLAYSDDGASFTTIEKVHNAETAVIGEGFGKHRYWGVYLLDEHTGLANPRFVSFKDTKAAIQIVAADIKGQETTKNLWAVKSNFIPNLTVTWNNKSWRVDVADRNQNKIKYRVKVNGEPISAWTEYQLPPFAFDVRINDGAPFKAPGQTNTLTVEVVDELRGYAKVEMEGRQALNGLYFESLGGDIYTNNMGEVKDTLNFGQVVLGQTAGPQALYVANYTDKALTNIKLTSNTLASFADNENFTGGWFSYTVPFLAPGQKFKFFVRMVTVPTFPEGTVDFTIFGEGEF